MGKIVEISEDEEITISEEWSPQRPMNEQEKSNAEKILDIFDGKFFIILGDRTNGFRKFKEFGYSEDRDSYHAIFVDLYGLERCVENINVAWNIFWEEMMCTYALNNGTFPHLYMLNVEVI